MNELVVTEYQSKRVLTTQQLSEVYETEQKNIHMNFSNNKDRFIEGRDYFILDGIELKTFKSETYNIGLAPNLNKLYLWTERGANRHCKILGTDKAWDQFDVLEESYFKSKNTSPKQMTELEILVQSAQALLEHDKAIKQLASTQIEHSEKLDKLMEIQSHKAEVVKELPLVNQMGLRSQLNHIARGYAERNTLEYNEVWNMLYLKFKYHYSIDVKIRAKNRKQKPLDYCQHNGYLPDMLSLAVNMFC